MQTPQGNILEWFYDDNGYGFDLFIGQKQSVTDGQFYASPDATIQAGMTYEEQLSQSQKPPTHSPEGTSTSTPDP